MNRHRVALALTLAFVVGLMVPLSGCTDTGSASSASTIADFGTYGSKLALQLAADFPNRSPGSEQELAASEFLAKEFKDLGYKVILQDFTFTDADGATHPSQNLIVRAKGDGVTVTDADGKVTSERRQIIVGAHYDVSVTAEQAQKAAEEAAALALAESESQAAAEATAESTAEGTAADTIETTAEIPDPTLADYDGIHANASGIGALLTVARQLKRVNLDYDVLLIAFGAGTADQAGAKAYLNAGLSDADLQITDAMYNIDGIYAGDDMYAHAGQNSVLPGNQKIYELRRRLYEATDVFFENALYTNNGYNLNTNQSSLNVDLGEDGQVAIYREWTFHRSDHTPFDQAGIPIVFFESFDYDTDSLDNMKESKNPALSPTGGTVRDTRFDSTDFLQYLFRSNPVTTREADQKKVFKERLEMRINNTAFIIVEAVKRKDISSTATSKA
ncbi:MAG: M28 family peptidase [Eubacteriales bacterium]|nr:M28 family peptidase [Eubacteriales bacterium]